MHRPRTAGRGGRFAANESQHRGGIGEHRCSAARRLALHRRTPLADRHRDIPRRRRAGLFSPRQSGGATGGGEMKFIVAMILLFAVAVIVLMMRRSGPRITTIERRRDEIDEKDDGK